MLRRVRRLAQEEGKRDCGWRNRRNSMEIGKIFGRGAEIRTPDLLVPNQALYQAEPRPEEYVRDMRQPIAATSSITSYCLAAVSWKFRITLLRVS
jgi:hypothetical protein